MSINFQAHFETSVIFLQIFFSAEKVTIELSTLLKLMKIFEQIPKFHTAILQTIFVKIARKKSHYPSIRCRISWRYKITRFSKLLETVSGGDEEINPFTVTPLT